MENVSLVARLSCVYDGRVITPGQRFVATRDDARLLILTNIAEEVVADGVLPEATIEPIYARKDETPADEPLKRKRGRPRKDASDGTYQRRDLRAEE